MRGKTHERQGRGPEQRGLGTTLKLFLDAAISGAINMSHCGCTAMPEHQARAAPPTEGGEEAHVSPCKSDCISQQLYKLNCLIGHKSCKFLGINKK